MIDARPIAADLQSRFRWVLLAVVLLGILARSIAEADPIAGLALALAGAAGWCVTELSAAGGSRGIPRWVSSILLVVVLLAVGVWAVQNRGPGAAVSAFSLFLAALIVVKLWERRQVRDYGQILMLSLFQVVGATLSGTSLLLGAILVVMVPLLAVAVMMYQVIAGSARAHPEHPRPIPAAPLRPALVGLALLMVLAASPIAAAIFVMVPRGVGFQQWGPVTRAAARRTTALTDQIDLTRGGLISESSARVLTVSLHEEPSHRPLGGIGERYYLRGFVLDTYGRGVWSRAQPSPLSEPVTFDSGQFHALDRSDVTGRMLILEVAAAAVPPVDAPIFSVYRPRSVEFGQVDSTVQAVIDPVTGVMTRSRGASLNYRVRSVIDDIPLPEHLRPVDRRGSLPAPAPRIAALAREQVAQAGLNPDPAIRPREDDALAARRIEAYLRLNFEYTLRPPAPPIAADPIEFFLFDSRRGHCEYFASAMAAMCRAVGIDARVIAGYVASEFDEDRQRYVVRESNAHAWVEVCTAPGLWRTYDPTPPSQLSRVAARQTSILGRLSQLFDRIEESWNASVVSFDENSQARLLGRGPGEPGALDRLLSWSRRASLRWRSTSNPLSLVLFAFAALVLAGAGVFLVRFLWTRRRGPVRASGWALSPPARAVHDHLLRVLRRRGLDKPDWQPLSAFAEGLRGSHPALASALRAAAADLYAASFRGPDPGALARAASAARDIESGRGRAESPIS
jgi:protein-glutamine gamma-glutamyltransferase